MDLGMAGRVMVVTGAESGMRRSMAEHLLREVLQMLPAISGANPLPPTIQAPAPCITDRIRALA